MDFGDTSILLVMLLLRVIVKTHSTLLNRDGLHWDVVNPGLSLVTSLSGIHRASL
jgi:hypothetical protein